MPMVPKGPSERPTFGLAPASRSAFIVSVWPFRQARPSGVYWAMSGPTGPMWTPEFASAPARMRARTASVCPLRGIRERGKRGEGGVTFCAWGAGERGGG